MLNILADALLLATRFGTLTGDARQPAHRTLTEADPRDAEAQRRSQAVK